MKRAIAALILLLFLALPASAASIERISFGIDLAELRENISVVLLSEQRLDSFVFSLPVKPENIVSESGYEVIEDDGYKILVKKEILPDVPSEFSVSFSAPDIVNKINGGEYLFSFSYNAPSDIREFVLRAALPEESAISEKGGLLVSRPVSIFTDGKRIFLEWESALQAGEQFSAFVQYKSKTEEGRLFTPILLILFLFAGLFVGYRIKKFRKEKFIEQAVSEDEKKIVDEIMKGEVLQEELREKTNFSKTKISKLVRSLEQKGIIKKTPYKKTNKLKLK